MKSKITQQRAVAALCLNKLIEQRIALPLAILDLSTDIDEQDKPLIQEMCYGSCRFYDQLQGIIDQLLNKPLRKKDQDIYQLLIIGAYQLLYMRIAAHAVISETVNATFALNKQWAKGMVNAVLRAIQRDKDMLFEQLKPYQKAALPQWLHGKIAKQWPEQANNIYEAYQSAAPLTLRVNQQKTNVADYLDQLKDRHIAAKPGTLSHDAIVLDKGVNVHALPNFDQGFCSVQDEAAQLAAQLVAQSKPARVLDACAAPGGKTCHLAEHNPQMHITALDNDAKRLLRVEENLNRLNCQANVICADAADTTDWWDQQQFDAILLDAPCSATGVIRRNPDIKQLRSPEDIDTLPALQWQILEALWPCLKPGGMLLYVTCSIMRTENDKVIERAIKQLNYVKLHTIEAQWGVSTQYGRQLLPSVGGNDGFYYACLYKTA